MVSEQPGGRLRERIFLRTCFASSTAGCFLCAFPLHTDIRPILTEEKTEVRVVLPHPLSHMGSKFNN